MIEILDLNEIDAVEIVFVAQRQIAELAIAVVADAEHLAVLDNALRAQATRQRTRNRSEREIRGCGVEMLTVE